MDTTNRAQILDEVVCISDIADTLVKRCKSNYSLPSLCIGVRKYIRGYEQIKIRR